MRRINLSEIRSFLEFCTRPNPVTGETGIRILFRRIHAIEEHLRNLEDRYALLEDRFNAHSNGVNHRAPKPKLPTPDKEM